MRQQRLLETFARELREVLDSGALAHRGRVELSDGVSVSFERMTRIVLADFERIAERPPGDPIDESAERQLYDDLTRLHALALGASDRRRHG
jgi:hypothetical protein